MTSVQITNYLLNSEFQNRNLIFVLRHAQKIEPKQGEFGNDAGLTLEGAKASEALGNSLAEIRIGAIYTSPLPRCVQTAEEFLKGSRQKIPIHASSVLGNPGPFVANAEEAGPTFLKNSLKEIAQNVVTEKRIPGVRSLAEGGKIFLDYVLSIRNFPCLMITHDIVICLLCCFFFRSKEVERYFPNFLEGFLLDIDDEKISIYYREEISHYFIEGL